MAGRGQPARAPRHAPCARRSTLRETNNNVTLVIAEAKDLDYVLYCEAPIWDDLIL
jgi:hypothetical protein